MNLVPIEEAIQHGQTREYGRSAKVPASMLDNPGMATEVTLASLTSSQKLIATLRRLCEEEHRHLEWHRKDSKTVFVWVKAAEPNGGNDGA